MYFVLEIGGRELSPPVPPALPSLIVTMSKTELLLLMRQILQTTIPLYELSVYLNVIISSVKRLS